MIHLNGFNRKRNVSAIDISKFKQYFSFVFTSFEMESMSSTVIKHHLKLMDNFSTYWSIPVEDTFFEFLHSGLVPVYVKHRDNTVRTLTYPEYLYCRNRGLLDFNQISKEV